MALATPTISVQDGTAAAVNLAANAAGVATCGNQLTIALQSSTGVLAAEWVIQAPGQPTLDGQRFRAVSSPFSFSVPLPQAPVILTINTEVTDGNNITSNTNTVSVQCGGNWVMMGSTTAATQAAPASVFVAACLLTARITGVFEVHLSVGWSDNTTADTVTWTFLTDTSASGQLAGANKAAHGFSGKGAGQSGSVAAGVNADAETMDGAGNLTYNGAAWSTAPITQKVEANPTLTGLLSGSAQKFVFDGRVCNAVPTGTTKTPFTIGNTVGFGVKVSATNSIAMPQIIMMVRELAVSEL